MVSAELAYAAQESEAGDLPRRGVEAMVPGEQRQGQFELGRVKREI